MRHRQFTTRLASHFARRLSSLGPSPRRGHVSARRVALALPRFIFAGADVIAAGLLLLPHLTSLNRKSHLPNDYMLYLLILMGILAASPPHFHIFVSLDAKEADDIASYICAVFFYKTSEF